MARDEQWAWISSHIVGDELTRGSSCHDNGMFVEAEPWIVRTGSLWRVLPENFGDWNSASAPEPDERKVANIG